VRQLTANTLDDELPSWSPDGRKLAFQRDFDPVVGEVDYDILTMHADCTRQRNLTRSPGIQDFDGSPAWSPDGRKITFTTDRDEDLEIYTMRADGSRQVNRTRNPAFDFDPDWQPLQERHH
jgi:Tol biopolymer transport system component